MRTQVFDFDKWHHHRSVWKYFGNIASMPFSHTLRAIMWPLAWLVMVTVVVVAEPLTITSFALSLLLVFRTNSSYGRFDEARKLWGLLLNRSRDLTRQIVAFYPPGTWQSRATSTRWVIAFAKCLLCHLRRYHSLRDELGDVLATEELQLVLASEHPVCICAQALSELIEASGTSTIQRLQMHGNVTTFNDILGGCERLLRTPIPIAYTRHTTRFVFIWLTVLPYALWDRFQWGTLAIAPLVSILLLGINEIGIDVEEPFSILPLEALTDRIKQDCTELINMQLARVRAYPYFNCWEPPWPACSNAAEALAGAAAAKVLLADRLLEAQPEGINSVVFDTVQDAAQTNLTGSADLLPLKRRVRANMMDGVVATDSMPAALPLGLVSVMSPSEITRPDSCSAKDDLPSKGSESTHKTTCKDQGVSRIGEAQVKAAQDLRVGSLSSDEPVPLPTSQSVDLGDVRARFYQGLQRGCIPTAPAMLPRRFTDAECDRWSSALYRSPMHQSSTSSAACSS